MITMRLACLSSDVNIRRQHNNAGDEEQISNGVFHGFIGKTDKRKPRGTSGKGEEGESKFYTLGGQPLVYVLLKFKCAQQVISTCSSKSS
jgi:hypothetical protein